MNINFIVLVVIVLGNYYRCRNNRGNNKGGNCENCSKGSRMGASNNCSCNGFGSLPPEIPFHERTAAIPLTLSPQQEQLSAMDAYTIDDVDMMQVVSRYSLDHHHHSLIYNCYHTYTIILFDVIMVLQCCTNLSLSLVLFHTNIHTSIHKSYQLNHLTKLLTKLYIKSNYGAWFKGVNFYFRGLCKVEIYSCDRVI